MKKVLLNLFFSLMALGHYAQAQCNFNASLSPQSVILCPNETAQLVLNSNTTNYESIVWYKWLGFGNFQPEVVPGFANQQQVDLNTFEHSGYYFFAAVTANGCTENSDTVLVDGYLFLPPVVVHGGTAELTQNGWEVACGQTATLELMMPYSEAITWFRNGVPMPGETSNLLTIEQSGTYTVQGAPDVCPALITPLGLELEYTVLPDPEVMVSVSENQLSTSDGISWQWMYNGDTLVGATQATLLAPESGQYQVWVDFGQGCLVLSDPVDVVVALTEAIIENDITISPNPFEQSIWLSSMEPVRYCLRDVNGRIVASGSAAGNDEIHFENIEAGIYIFEYRINNNERNHKLLIKK
jgi:hypothetical protein